MPLPRPAARGWPPSQQARILPSNQNPLGALPARFRRERVLIVGCGDVAWRFAGISMAGWNVLISVVLAGFSLLAAKRPKDARAPRS